MDKVDQAIISRWKKLPVFLQWVLCWPVGFFLMWAGQIFLVFLFSLLLRADIMETMDMSKPKTIGEFIFIFTSVFIFVWQNYFFIEYLVPNKNEAVAKIFIVLYWMAGAMVAWGTFISYQSEEMTVVNVIANALITLILLMVPVIMTKKLMLNIQRGNGDKNAL